MNSYQDKHGLIPHPDPSLESLVYIPEECTRVIASDGQNEYVKIDGVWCETENTIVDDHLPLHTYLRRFCRQHESFFIYDYE